MNWEWLERNGKVQARGMILSGEKYFLAEVAVGMAREMYADVEEGIMQGSGHYLVEENREDYVLKVLGFVEAS